MGNGGSVADPDTGGRRRTGESYFVDSPSTGWVGLPTRLVIGWNWNWNALLPQGESPLCK